MPYRHQTEDRDYSDYASGRVLYHAPGAPAFPVRLAAEIFARARRRLASPRPLAIYDPTCGGAYHLSALGFLFPGAVASILASDADPRALELARRNLGLLEPDGLAQREQELRLLLEQYGKQSHADALRSLEALRLQRAGAPHVETRCFLANALDPAALAAGLRGAPVDLVLSDIPHGRLSDWIAPDADGPPAEETGAPPAERLLDALRGALQPPLLMAISADKSQRIAHPAFQRVERFQVGKRQVVILQPAEPPA